MGKKNRRNNSKFPDLQVHIDEQKTERIAKKNSRTKPTRIYTDGSCLRNPGGPSGWSFCVCEDDRTWLVGGGEPSSTNNRMELTAVIEALQWVTPCEYELYTDSLLTLNCAKKLWKRKANMDLWVAYDAAIKGKILNWHWVKGHSGDEFNELVDSYARKEAKIQKNKILFSNKCPNTQAVQSDHHVHMQHSPITIMVDNYASRSREGKGV